ncbi:MAG TPA: LysM peptidoglycan-binding domain-containing protein [Oculatellaceae cyanobacterium]
MQKNLYADREADLKKQKDDKKDGSAEQGDDVLGKKKIADTSPFANDAPTRPEQANQSAENITNQMAQANGIGKAGEKTYETSQGAITGGEYTNKNGTFLVANNSEGQAVKYKVETDATTGAKTLVDQAGKGETLQVKAVETPAVRTGESTTTPQSSTERQSTTPTERQSATPTESHPPSSERQNISPPEKVPARGDGTTTTPAPISDGQTQPKHGTDATKQPPASVVGQTIDATPPSSAKPNAGDAPAPPGPTKTPTASDGSISTPPVKTVTDTPPPVQTHPAAPAPGADGQIKPSSPTTVTGGIDSSTGQPQPIIKPGTPVATSTEGQVVTSGPKPSPVPTISDSSPQPPAKTAPVSDAGALQPAKPGTTTAPVAIDAGAPQPAKPGTPGAPVAIDAGTPQPAKPGTPGAPIAAEGTTKVPTTGTDTVSSLPKPNAPTDGPISQPVVRQPGDGGIQPSPAKPVSPSDGPVVSQAPVPASGDLSGTKPVGRSPVDGPAGVPGQIGQDGPGKLAPITTPTESNIGKTPALPGDTTPGRVSNPVGDTTLGKVPTPPVDTTLGKLPTQPGETTLGKVTTPAGDVSIASGATTGGLDKLRPTTPTEATPGIGAATFAPNPAQAAALKQVGFDINNPTDVSFLASARAQLQAARLAEGNSQLTLANVLGNANAADANKLAAFLSGKPDALASQVTLSDANLGKLNALFKTEAATLATVPTPLDTQKAALGRGMADFMAAANPATLSQRDIYNEMNKLTAHLQPNDASQRLGMAELLGRTLTPQLRPDVQTPVTTTRVETSIVKPENQQAVNNALAEARTRADVADLTPKPVPTAARADMADNAATLAAASRGLQPQSERIPLPDAGKTAEHGIRQNTMSTTEGIANTKIPTEEAGRGIKMSAELAGADRAAANTDRATANSARSDMVETNEKHVEAKKKHETSDHTGQGGQGGAGGGFGIDASILTGAALRVVDTTGSDKIDATKKKDDDEKKTPRRRYVVRFNDSLKSIAQKAYKDERIGVLIGAINSEVIQENTPLDEPLKAGMQIWLPSESEVQSFFENINDYMAQREQLSPEEELARRFGNGWSGNQNPSLIPPIAKSQSRPWPTESIPAAQSQASTGPNTEPSEGLTDTTIAAAKRRENVEKVLGPLGKQQQTKAIEYTVRLGDSLKSIATKHPALQDVALWELIASVNKITVPGRDSSAVKLNRGSKLILPTPDEIAEFREEKAEKKASNAGSQTVITSNLRMPPTKPITAPPTPFLSGPTTGGLDDQGFTRATAPITDAGASMLRAGGFVKAEQQRVSEDAETVSTAAIQPSKPIMTDKPQVENVKQLADDCRIVRRHMVDQNGRLYQAQLEVNRRGEWLTVMMYNISEGNCWRKCINEHGVTEILPLELPTPAIHQMLESDFSNNWEEHRDRFLKQPV